MKIRKGSEVRILRTNEIGTIKDIELIRKNEEVHKYCHVVTKEKPEIWIDSSELGDIIEKVTVDWYNESNGQKLVLELAQNHKSEELSVRIYGNTPKVLNKQDGLHTVLVTKLLNALRHDSAQS